jgi:O-glycosyl hydrolase
MNRKTIIRATGVMLAVLLFVPGCDLAVNDPVRIIPIVEPYISVQPKSHSFFISSFEEAPELTVEVSGWQRLDGKLTYQWYTFADMTEYCDNGGTAIDGETGSSYTPFNLNYSFRQNSGKSFYYYVVVTNDYPNAQGNKKASVQSEMAIISFYNSTLSPFPVITKQPVNASYVIGKAASVTPLEVRATGAGLTYQWYTNTKYGVTGGEEIEGNNTASFMPDIGDLAKGENYFYVTVTNNITGTDPTEISLPVKITLIPSERAATPQITVQPQSQTVFSGGSVRTLTVEAEVSDDGIITYQWYSADKAAATRTPSVADERETYTLVPVVSTKLEGETGPSFTPVITSGTHYYYVEITNTNEDATEVQTAKRPSKTATIQFAAASGAKTANAFITVPDNYNKPGDPSRKQFIRGYGGMDVAWANFPNTTKAETELQYNQDWGLGYNILRIMIVPPGSTQGNYTNHADIIMGRQRPPDADQTWSNQGWNGLILGGQRPDYINNVKVVNDNGGYVLASPWTPPKEWKTNNSINSGGHLMPSEYVSFANYLRSFCQYMYYQGAPVYAVSIANEPNYAGGYDGCEWDDSEGQPHMMNFFLKVGQFTQGARGYGGGKSIPRVLIVNGESANDPKINFPGLGNPTSRAAVDFFARHVYGSQTLTLWRNEYADYKEDSPYKTECWMTEHNINSANSISFPNDHTWRYIWRFMNDVDLVIRRNNENAFVWWASKRFYSMIGDGQYKCVQGQVLPRGYGLSHYAKYSNETTRIEVGISGNLVGGAPIGDENVNFDVLGTFSLDDQSVKVTAFVSQDGNEISFVMFTPTTPEDGGGYDMGTIEISMPAGFRIGNVQAVRSSISERMADITGSVAVVKGSGQAKDKAYVDLRNSQLISVKFTKE